MSDIVAFIRERMDEREAWAKASDGTTFNPDYLWSEDVARGFSDDDLRHIAANDPAYVLADVAAKRRILEWIDVTEDRSISTDAWAIGNAIRVALALPYADHPDFKPAWRPTA